MVSASRSCHWCPVWTSGDTESSRLTSIHLGDGREGGGGINCHIQAFLDSMHVVPGLKLCSIPCISVGTQWVLCFGWSRKSPWNPTPGSWGGTSFLTISQTRIFLKREVIR